MCNQEIKQAAKQACVPLWKLADTVYHITDSHFSRKLRHELPVEEKQKLMAAIEELAKEGGGKEA